MSSQQVAVQVICRVGSLVGADSAQQVPSFQNFITGDSEADGLTFLERADES